MLSRSDGQLVRLTFQKDEITDYSEFRNRIANLKIHKTFLFCSPFYLNTLPCGRYELPFRHFSALDCSFRRVTDGSDPGMQ